jgi:hypothetical protein
MGPKDFFEMGFRHISWRLPAPYTPFPDPVPSFLIVLTYYFSAIPLLLHDLIPWLNYISKRNATDNTTNNEEKHHGKYTH